MLRLKKITKEYPTGDGKVTALKGIDIAFRKNEFVSILGQSGCGKTTLLNIIGGLDHYTSGDLIINGKSTKEFNDADWDSYRNHSVGFVFQSYNLIPHQSVLANVELALTVSGVSKAERRRRAVEALEKVGLSDQLNKRPNQMSGGQMQRVAIARALVNNPDILLADEPTGALDSATSVQVMEILREISRDKLIVMVTHNPELAEKYSTRIVRLLDGVIMSDSNPCTEEEDAPALTKEEQKRKKVKDTTKSMSPATALSLSLNNLMTKKGRTFLTSFAGSIGIIGIALILSVSNGVQAYIDRVQEDTLSSYPITIQSETVEMSGLIQTMMQQNNNSGESRHELDAVYSNSVMYELMNSMNAMETTKNNLAPFKEFLDTDEEFKSYASAVQITYGAKPEMYAKDKDGNIIRSDLSALFENLYNSMGYGEVFQSVGGMYSTMSVWEEMLPGENGALLSDLLYEQYDLIYGSWPEKYDEVVLLVNENNEISDIVLYALGLKSSDEMSEIMKKAQAGEQVEIKNESWSYSDICGMEFRMILPADTYRKNADGTFSDLSQTEAGLNYLYGSDSSLPVKVVGILRPSEKAVSSMMGGAIGYTSALTDYAFEHALSSDVVKAQLADPDTDVLTGLPFPSDSDAERSDAEKAQELRDYLATLPQSERAAIYTEILAQPSEEYVENALTQTMAGMDRAAMVSMLTQAYAQQMQMDDTSAVQSYIDGLDDETLTGYIRDIVRAQITQQYAQSVTPSLTQLSAVELEAMFEQAQLSDQTLAVFYESVMPATESDSTYEENLQKIGYVDLSKPQSINIYAATFAAKDAIADVIDRYNESAADADKISYTDYVALMMSSITTVINAISYVLIAFVAISLVVSSIMIGIITYISVLERTKEIGILRAIGASKRDVARVFNAETLIVGFVAGVLGIGVTLLLTIPINLIIHALTGITILNATLPAAGAVILVLISMVLTYIAGLIPSSIAAKKDPVVALRTE